MNIDAWLKSGEYLPPPLRDFHDQKDAFKAIHESINVAGHGYCKDVDWIKGQCYVIDIFLWWMARRGYTLQRSRARLPFRDLSSDVRAITDRRNASFTDMLKKHTAQSQPDPGLPA